MLIQEVADTPNPLVGRDIKGTYMARPGDLPELFGLARAGEEVFAVVRLVGQFVLQVRDDKDGARTDPSDDSHRADLGQPHAGDLLAKEDNEVGEREGGQACEARKEHVDIARKIGEAALANQTAH